MCANDDPNPGTGPDIWFNALVSCEVCNGKSNEIELNPAFIPFISFVAQYGDELRPNISREDNIRQCQDATYGIYSLFKQHPFEASIALGGLSGIYNYLSLANHYDKQVDLDIDYDTCYRQKNAENVILYGVPGAGKSWTIKNEYCDNDSCMERLVFHPDYTYSDFVGQIMPKVDADGTVKYVFQAGPFTKLLAKAYKNPQTHYYLIIEEINRGNAPAIFGDVFQLLDRNPDGGSEYKITNHDIALIVYGDALHKVSIPSNFNLIATMNTSDQNVFTLDTAFQRRWTMRLIKNRFGSTISERALADANILDTNVRWEHFLTVMNKIILSKNVRMTSAEDKRLGTHFVTINDLLYVSGDTRQNQRFPEKVLKYLWDDAFKFSKDEVFDLEKAQTLEEFIELFLSERGDKRFIIFKDGILNKLI